MGEHAEDALDDLLFGRGGCSSYGREYPTSIRCARCGLGPFDWQRTGPWRDPKWRLANDDGTLHVCPPPKPEDLFDDLTQETKR